MTQTDMQVGVVLVVYQTFQNSPATETIAPGPQRREDTDLAAILAILGLPAMQRQREGRNT